MMPVAAPPVEQLIVGLARKYRLDPQAVLAVAAGEGGVRYGAVGDQGTSFGAFQLHIGGASPYSNPAQAAAFANSPQGIEYALRKMAEAGAAGLTGPAAVEAIIRGFERPKNIPASVQAAVARYGAAGGSPDMGGGVPGLPGASQSAGVRTNQGRAAFAQELISQIGQQPDVLRLVGALRSGAPGGSSPPGAGAEAAAPVAMKGNFAFPVAGPSQFTDTWGAPRATTGRHEGVDLFAAKGTPVVALENGTVTKMGPSRIGGNRVWLNGRWYYAHLAAFARGLNVGSRVRRGQVIGYVGDTGDAAGTPPHLHFGFDPKGSQGAAWADPFPILRGIQG